MVRKGCTACYDLVAELPALLDRRHRRGRPRLSRHRPARRDRPDDGGRQLLPGDPRPARRDAARSARARGGRPAAAARRQPRDLPQAARRLVMGPRSVAAGARATIPHHCSDDFIIGCRDLARDHGIGVQMHLGEVEGAGRGRPEAHTARRSPAISTSLACWRRTSRRHTRSGSTMTTLPRLANSGAAVAHNPGSNLKLGSGLARTRLLRDRGIDVRHRDRRLPLL